MNAPPTGLPNPVPFALISRLCLRLASPILLIAFVLQLSGMGDLPDSRRVFDLGATHRQIMDHQLVIPSGLFRVRTSPVSVALLLDGSQFQDVKLV